MASDASARREDVEERNAAKTESLPPLRTAIESRYTLRAAAPISIPGTRE